MSWRVGERSIRVKQQRRNSHRIPRRLSGLFVGVPCQLQRKSIAAEADPTNDLEASRLKRRKIPRRHSGLFAGRAFMPTTKQKRDEGHRIPRLAFGLPVGGHSCPMPSRELRRKSIAAEPAPTVK
jgi:hypothetical protein